MEKYGNDTDLELCDIDVGEFLEFIDYEVHMILYPNWAEHKLFKF